ncbi:MAG: tetratricopeptide repeat protein [Phycisphaerales bacterium]
MPDRAESIVDQARALAPDRRQAYLRDVCGDDLVLRAKVDAMLADDVKTVESRRDIDSDATVPQTERITAATPHGQIEHPGQQIRCYRLLDRLGEGGFGTVWAAEQKEPVKRRVALKIIKLGMDTKQVIARFEQERQALAMMDHPNIAGVLDAGATETGRPFFVMELVKGDPIDEYCDKNHLSIEDRLELFAQVCNAVQHAHTKGIIHRDIKPSNVLVSTQDGKPHTKVIDFGIAKATASKLTEKTLFTEHRQLIGTPEYMSPEQAEGSLDVDTRTDVYSLGVLLYELLTGTTPFSSQELRSAAYAEIQRIIREVEPPKPSTRIGNNTGTIASVAARRHTEPRRLGTIVRGELDWIVMKALEKDRQRRYETANGLGLDIRRYLSGEAVLAAPPSTSYRFKKFIRRNKGPVAAGGLVAAALVLGLIGTSVGLVRAEQARAGEAAQRLLADEARSQAVAQEIKAKEQEAEAVKQAAAAKAQEAEAKQQAQIARAVVKFQTEMLAAVDPNQLPRDPVTKEPIRDAVTVLQVMRAAVKVLDEGGNALKEQPLVEADVRATIGITLLELARYDEAEPNLRKSLAIWRANLPAEHPTIARSLNTLAMLLMAQSKPAEAEPLYREALAIYRAARPAGDPDIATNLSNLAGLLHAQNKPAEAEPLYRDALAIWRAALPAGRSGYAATLSGLGLLLQDQNKLAEAESLLRESLDIRRATLPAGHSDIAKDLSNLAGILDNQNKFAEAEPLYREALAIWRAALPAGHPDIATGLNNLAAHLVSQNKFAEAEPLYREALAIWRAALPAGHRDIALSLDNLAKLLQVQNKLAEAESLQREALAMRRAALPAGHPDIALGLNNLAMLLRVQNKFAEAEPLLRESLAIRRATLPAGHPDIAMGLNNLAMLLHDQNHLTEAEPLFREALEIVRAALPAGHPDIALGLNNLAMLLEAQNRFAEAEPLLREALEIRRAAFPAGHPDTATCLTNLAQVLEAQNKLAEAEPLLRESLEIRRAVYPAGHPTVIVSSQSLGVLLWKQGKLDQSIPVFEESLESAATALGRRNPHTIAAMVNLGVNYKDAGRIAEAVALLEEAYTASKRDPSTASVGRLLLDAYAKAADPAKPESIVRLTTLVRELLADAAATLPEESPELAGQLAGFSQTLLTLNAWDEAEPLVRECLAIREKTQPDAWTTFNTKSMLGGVLLGQSKLAEAEPLLLAGYQGLKDREATIPPLGKARIPEALERLVKLYEIKGNEPEAAAWRRRLEAAKAAQGTPEPKRGG